MLVMDLGIKGIRCRKTKKKKKEKSVKYGWRQKISLVCQSKWIIKINVEWVGRLKGQSIMRIY